MNNCGILIRHRILHDSFHFLQKYVLSDTMSIVIFDNYMVTLLVFIVQYGSSCERINKHYICNHLIRK